MSGANSIDCERCKSKQLASRQCVLRQLPEVLVIHLKRYRQVISGRSARLVKDSTKVKIDKELEIKGVAYRDRSSKSIDSQYSSQVLGLVLDF